MLRVVEAYSDTNTGRQRRMNEDALFARAPLFAVADGMGGAQAGEVASRAAVETLEHGLPDGPQPAEERLAALVHEANARIFALSQADEGRAGMGTTMTAAYLAEEDLAVAHVGDSRLYVLRDGELRRLTRDHSLVEELVQEGRLTPEEADEHPQRSIITRALGPDDDVEVDHLTFDARPGDVFLICSDGLTSMVAEAHVGEVVRDAGTLRDAGRALIDAANRAGGRDNITVVLFRVGEVPGAAGATAEQHTMVGAAAPRAADVHAAATAAGPEAAAAVPMTPEEEAAAVARRAPRPPRAPDLPPRHRRGKAFRRVRSVLITLVILAPIVLGLWGATRSIYFVGTDDEGFVALYHGVPYELPFGITLYDRTYSSGVVYATLPAQVQRTVTDHELRSNGDAKDLIGRMERGELEGQQP